jgi:hypothetical protein
MGGETKEKGLIFIVVITRWIETQYKPCFPKWNKKLCHLGRQHKNEPPN